MADVSAARRKLGLGAIAGTALLALPLTASISYAQPEAPEPPAAPDAPSAPLPPDAPAAPQVRRHLVIVERPDGAVIDEQTLSGIPDDEALAEADAEIAEAMAEARAAMAEARQAMAEQQDAMAEHRQAMIESRRAIARAQADMPRFEMDCDGEEAVRERVDADGRRVIVMCRRAVQASATQGLRQAQRAVRSAPGIPDEQRQQIIDDLQEQIDRLDAEQVSFNVAPVAPVAPVSAVPAVAPVAYPVASVRVVVKAPRAPAAPATPATRAVQFAPVALWLKDGALVLAPVIS